MSNDSIIKKQVRERKYLNRTFDSFRSDLLNYARSYYPDKIQDFSDSSVGGLFLDFAAYVGDATSYYLDHQFTELDPEYAVENSNIERHLRNSGVEIIGASPAVSYVDFTIEIDADSSQQNKVDSKLLPIIKEGTELISTNGTQFNLTEDLDYSSVDKSGNLIARMEIASTDSTGSPTSYYLTLVGLCISGYYEQETFSIQEFTPFKRITLSNQNVSEVVHVYDDKGNTYYEVKDLSDDVIFKRILNKNDDGDLVKDNLIVVPAPFRFKKEVSLDTRNTTLIFGGGSAETLEDDVIPDPSDFALPLYGKSTFSISSINPNDFLKSKTLGVAASNTTLTVVYRWGGGLNNNVHPGAINDVKVLYMDFPYASTGYSNKISFIRSTLSVNNKTVASGGEDAPTVEELKSLIPQSRNSQSRIVTKEDLLSRIYMIPTNFGRVFRAGIRSNPDNPLATQLFVISRDSNSKLIISPDALKENLSTYLNQYRLISDAIDILDAGVVNLKLEFEITVDQSYNRQIVLQAVLKDLKKYFSIKNFNIDQPIVISDVVNVIYNIAGVVSVNNKNNKGMIKFTNMVGNVDDRLYSFVNHDINVNIINGILIPPPGGIFEIKYPDVDIIGTAI